MAVRDWVSVAILVMCDRLVSHLYSSGTASLVLLPSAAAFAYWPAFSLPRFPGAREPSGS